MCSSTSASSATCRRITGAISGASSRVWRWAGFRKARLIIPSSASRPRRRISIAGMTISPPRWPPGAALMDPNAPLEERHIGSLQGAVTVAIRRNSMKILPNLLLIWRALVLLDTTILRLPVQFDLLAALGNFFRSTTDAPALIREIVHDAPARCLRTFRATASLSRRSIHDGPVPSFIRINRLESASRAASLRRTTIGIVCATAAMALAIVAGSGSASTMNLVGGTVAAVLLLFTVLS